jgi:aryl-alcohol dehydrogenase-like predicted oxidoreductase
MSPPVISTICHVELALQVQEIAGALGWRLTEAEVLELDKASDKIPTSLGAPFENW